MTQTITFKGAPLTLIGRTIHEGMPAPSFNAHAQDLKEVTLSDTNKKIRLVSVFPSLDTPVCDLQVKEFNKHAGSLGKDILVINMSKDLPFAQQRFCQLNSITDSMTLSDYQTSSFGLNYGLLIKELNLLARAVLIIDTVNVLRYIQIADELTKPLDYTAALKYLETVVTKPAVQISGDAMPAHCSACEGKITALPTEKVEKSLAQYRGWKCVEMKKLTKEFLCEDFAEAKYYIDLLALIAKEQGHHPIITLNYSKITVSLTTHAARGLTENDFIMAKIIDSLGIGEKA